MKSHPPPVETKRINELKVGDRFRIFSITYFVREITERRIIYQDVKKTSGPYSMGRNSKRKVEVILGQAP